MAAKKRGDNKLRLIAGGAAPKVVVTGRREPSREPSRDPLRLQSQRPVRAERDEIDEPIVAEPEHRMSTVAPRSWGIPRAAIFAAVVVVVGAMAYALTRSASNKPAPAPQLTATPPADWASQKVAPMASPSASASP